MKFGEMTANGYEKLSEIHGSEFIDSVKYIEFMASSMHKNINDWEFDSFVNTSGKPYVDKSKINQKFMEQMAAAPASTTVFKLSDSEREAISKNYLSKGNEMRKEWIGTRENIERMIQEKGVQYRTLMEQLRQVSVKINSFIPEETNGKIETDLERIVNENFWEWKGLSPDGNYELTTKAPVTLSLRNPAAKLDLSVNLGRFLIQIGCNSLQPMVKALDGNILYKGKCHPHVDGNGRFCWGDHLDIFNHNVKNNDVYAILNCAKDLLQSYSDGNPYVRLYDMWVIKELSEIDKNRIVTKPTSGRNSFILRDEESFPYITDKLTSLTKDKGVQVSPRELEPFLEVVCSPSKKLYFADGAIYIHKPRAVRGEFNVNGHPFLANFTSHTTGDDVKVYSTGVRSGNGNFILENFEGQTIDNVTGDVI